MKKQCGIDGAVLVDIYFHLQGVPMMGHEVSDADTRTARDASHTVNQHL